jgi:hypothetical protein
MRTRKAGREWAIHTLCWDGEESTCKRPAARCLTCTFTLSTSRTSSTISGHCPPRRW